MAKLIEFIDSDDERVASVAANSVLDRAFGKPRERPLEDDKLSTRIDLSRLTDEQLAALAALFNSGAILPVEDAAGIAEVDGRGREVTAAVQRSEKPRHR